MNVADLAEHEALALVVLAKAMIHADGEVSKNEMLDLMSLAQVFGMERFKSLLDTSGNTHRDGPAVVRTAGTVERYDARVLIFVLLEELAKGDGTLAVERNFLADLQAFWELSA